MGIGNKGGAGRTHISASDDAQEVRHLFMRLLHEKQVDVHLSEPVLHIQTKKGCAAGVVTGKELMKWMQSFLPPAANHIPVQVPRAMVTVWPENWGIR